jgi:CheY-like chemotaxis protein
MNNTHRRILVVDDNESIHNDFRKILSQPSKSEDAFLAASAELFGEETVPKSSPGFELGFASQGEEAMKLVRSGLENGCPYAMAFMDVRMPPGLDGIETTARIWEIDPDLQVVICSAFSDYSYEQIIAKLGCSDRFVILKKPFERIEALQLASAFTEKRLLLSSLQETIGGSTRLLTDILSMLDSQLFGQAQRLRDAVDGITNKLLVPNPWEIKMAALLAPIGYAAIPPETMAKSQTGNPLSDVEKQMLARVPETSARLLGSIPRLEGVAHIVRYQLKNFDGSGSPSDTLAGISIPFGSRLLKILSDFIVLQNKGVSRTGALDEMQARQGCYDKALLTNLRDCFNGRPVEPAPAAARTVSLPVKKLSPGMVLRSNVETRDGKPILASGHKLNEVTIEKILNFDSLNGIKEPILVEINGLAV